MGIKIKKAVFEPVADGKYFAKVKEFSTIPTVHGEALRWSFQTINQDGSPGLTVSGLTGTVGSPKAKLTRYCSACGVVLNDNEIDIDALIGKDVVITVETKAGSDYSNVTNCEPVSMYRNVTPVSQPLPPNGQSPQQTPIQR